MVDASEEYCVKTLALEPSQVRQLQLYVALLRQWQPKLNLISANTMVDIWQRHILDSSQIKSFLPPTPTLILDIGTGAGFPGIVLGVISLARLILVEADQRKAIFLQEVIRQLFPQQYQPSLPNLPKIQVLNDRVEKLPFLSVDVITARAVASLDQLFFWSLPQWHNNSRAIFLKGKNFQQEIDLAAKNWTFNCDVFPSITDQDGRVLVVENLKSK